MGPNGVNAPSDFVPENHAKGSNTEWLRTGDHTTRITWYNMIEDAIAMAAAQNRILHSGQVYEYRMNKCRQTTTHGFLLKVWIVVVALRTGTVLMLEVPRYIELRVVVVYGPCRAICWRVGSERRLYHSCCPHIYSSSPKSRIYVVMVVTGQGPVTLFR